MLSEQALADFKRIWLEEHGEEVPHEVAVEEAANLLTLFDAIYHPLRLEWLDENDHEKDRRHSEQ